MRERSAIGVPLVGEGADFVTAPSIYRGGLYFVATGLGRVNPTIMG